MKKILLCGVLSLVLVFTLTGCDMINGVKNKLSGEKSYYCKTTSSTSSLKQTKEGIVITKDDKAIRYEIIAHLEYQEEKPYQDMCKKYKETVDKLPESKNKYELKCNDSKKTIDVKEIYMLETIDSNGKSLISTLYTYIDKDGKFDNDGWISYGKKNGYTCGEK